jgi:hypothetical protein
LIVTVCIGANRPKRIAPVMTAKIASLHHIIRPACSQTHA